MALLTTIFGQKLNSLSSQQNNHSRLEQITLCLKTFVGKPWQQVVKQGVTEVDTR